MSYLLDTNVCVTLLRNRNPLLTNKVLAQPSRSLALCTIVEAELYLGAYRSAQVQKNIALVNQFIGQFVSIPFDQQAAHIAGQVGALLASQGTPIGPYDLLIAALALAHNLTVVTHNIKEFGRVKGLPIVDWET